MSLRGIRAATLERREVHRAEHVAQCRGSERVALKEEVECDKFRQKHEAGRGGHKDARPELVTDALGGAMSKPAPKPSQGRGRATRRLAAEGAEEMTSIGAACGRGGEDRSHWRSDEQDPSTSASWCEGSFGQPSLSAASGLSSQCRQRHQHRDPVTHLDGWFRRRGMHWSPSELRCVFVVV